MEQELSKNLAAVMRRLENGGFTHDQAVILAEVLHDEVTEQIATKEHVDLFVDRASKRLEKMIHVESKSTVKWVAGMMVVQTVAIPTGDRWTGEVVLVVVETGPG